MLGDLDRSVGIPRRASIRPSKLSVFGANYGKLEPKTSTNWLGGNFWG
jgi:hypothetical protein